MSSIFSFFQPLSAAAFSLEQVPVDMLNALRAYLPPPVAGMPAPDVILMAANDVGVGVGNYIGGEQRGPLMQVEVKGGRLDARIRFMLWGSNANEVNVAMLALQGRLLAVREALRSVGFLKIIAQDSTLAQHDTELDAWGRLADYQVLYEFRYDHSDAAQSLIARIPINADQEQFGSAQRESTVVTDELVRWDNENAQPLVLRGRTAIGVLTALAFLGTTAPDGTVTLTRTFDGAVDPPEVHPDLVSFLAALNDPSAPQRNARLVFATLSDFLAGFTETGTPQPLGDWDLDGALDEYRMFELAISPAITLSAAGDRLEVSYGNGNEPLNQIAVLYLRASRA